MDVLCAPTFPAPAILWSIETGSSNPSLTPTACTSVMILRTSVQTSGSFTISASVARVSALIGLKAAFPRIFTQISLRIRVVTGARRPDLISASAIRRLRSERVPSGSPSEMRLPSVSIFTTRRFFTVIRSEPMRPAMRIFLGTRVRSPPPIDPGSRSECFCPCVRRPPPKPWRFTTP